MDAKFEEKTFEGYLNSELANSSKFFFPFGQVQEGVIGLDAAFYTRSLSLWWQLGMPLRRLFGPGGINLLEIADEMEQFISETASNIPNLRANLLLQYKRPEYISVSSGKEWPFWFKPYFRYRVDDDQHALLSHLAKKFKGSALVLYAAPAAKKVDELVRNHVNGSTLKNTNFTSAERLDGHKVNTYIKSGTYSIACSEPERIGATDIYEAIDAIKAPSEGGNSSSLVIFAEGLSSTLKESSVAPSYRQAFRDRLEQLGSDQLADYPLFKAHVEARIFSEVTGTRWVSAF